ncbi:MAG TPA: hexitol phosphatase HxpB [Bacteroidia bacterium]|jgi:HAD superfamily hydrolase (TIGR01509 family)|nr:hexitol phosphatase HxpB [Bacteroidia bacterium]
MKNIKAVIFDMDGVLIDSEPLWRIAMIQGFGDIGVEFTDEDCRKTTGMRFKEVVEHWFKHHNITHSTPIQLNDAVHKHLVDLIIAEGNAMKGAIELLDFLKMKKFPLGLATSSSHILVDAVLHKTQTKPYFHSITSAEFLEFGKPHPEVFLKCAESLNISPKNCLVIEDSINGVLAGKAAGMTVIAVPDEEHKNDNRFEAADYRLNNLSDVIKLF